MADPAAHIIDALIVPHPAEPALLVTDAPDGLALPFVEDTTGWHWARVDWLNNLIQEQLGLSTTVLRCASSHVERSSRQGSRIYVLEMSPPDAAAPPGTRWAGRHEIAREAFADAEQQAQVDAWLAEADGHPISPLRAPWARPGWFAQARDWIGRTVSAGGLQQRGVVEQVKAWTISSILRVPTAVGAMYFKASGPSFPREAAITEALAALAPSHLPAVVATDRARSWLLMHDLSGTRLDRVSDIERWEEALRVYARMQIEAIPQVRALLAAGCRDRRLAGMHAEIETALADTGAMTPDQPVGRQHLNADEQGLAAGEIARIQALAPMLHDAVERLAAAPVPDTLEHGDFHAANVVDVDGQLRIFDWSDACVAYPFFSLLPFFEFHTPPEVPGARERLLRAYLEPWTAFAPMPALLELVPLAQTIAVIQQVMSYQHILATVEPALRWEWVHAVPYFLRMLLRDGG